MYRKLRHHWPEYLIEAAGLGTRDLSRIETTGMAVKEVMFDFAKIRRERRASSRAL